MPEVLFTLWLVFDSGQSVSPIVDHGYITKKECEQAAKTAKTLMKQPKYVRHICTEKRILPHVSG